MTPPKTQTNIKRQIIAEKGADGGMDNAFGTSQNTAIYTENKGVQIS